MRKWTYLVAALLMSGTAATFTSCIDNEEPAGIEAMRNAKADFYAAQALVKQAQVAYQNALAEYEMQLVEEMKLKNKALEIANKLAEASSAKDIAALEAAKAELLAQHEVKMKQIAADKAMADAAYEKAMVELAKIISAVNGEYTAEYARLLAKVTDNIAKYDMAAAKVTDLQLSLAKLTLNEADTAYVRLDIQKEIDKYELQLKYLKKQHEILTTISAPEANAEASMAELDKQIRELANDFNKKIDQMNNLFARKAQEQSTADVFSAEHNKANEAKYSKAVVVSIPVPKNIQHDFATKINDANSTSGTIDGNKTLAASTKVNGADKYYLTDPSGNYVINVAEISPIPTGGLTVTTSTTTSMSTKLSALMVGTGSTASPAANSILKERLEAFKSAVDASATKFNQEQFDHKYQELDGYKKAEELFKTEYEADLNTYKDVLGKYKTAITNYMYNSNKTYYVYLNEKIADLTADLSSTDAATKAAAQRELLPILQKYGEYRMALDGWAYGTSATEEPLYKTIQESAITAANANQILGTATLNIGAGKATYKDAKPYDEYPYAAIKKASDEAFGAHAGTITGIDFVINIPELEDELFTLNPDLVATHGTWGGSFGDYYAQANIVRTLEKAKSWCDVVKAAEAAQEVVNKEFVTWALEEAAFTNNHNALLAVVKNTKNEIDKLGLEIVNAAGSTVATAPSALNITYEDGTAIGTSSNNAKKKDIKPITPVPGGTIGSYISKLITLHNGIAGGLTNYETELQALNDDIADVTKLYNDELRKMEQFNNGGYDKKPDGTVVNPTSDKVEFDLSKGVTVTLTPTASTDDYGTIDVTIQYPTTDGGSESGTSTPEGSSSIGVEQFEIKYSGSWYSAAISTAATADKVDLSPNFLKSLIEAKEAGITFWKNKMEDYKKEGEYIQKELDAFLAVINARYPAAQ
ncbi:hypothetical protein QVN91_00005 [Bacteroides caecigallinarum]|nr:hypothetical protein [Bacteroides caecigallinarum]